MFEPNNVFLPRSSKQRSNEFGFERKRKFQHRHFSPRYMQKYQVLMSGKQRVDTISLKIRWWFEDCYQLEAVTKVDGNFFTSDNF